MPAVTFYEPDPLQRPVGSPWSDEKTSDDQSPWRSDQRAAHSPWGDEKTSDGQSPWRSDQRAAHSPWGDEKTSGDQSPWRSGRGADHRPWSNERVREDDGPFFLPDPPLVEIVEDTRSTEQKSVASYILNQMIRLAPNEYFEPDMHRRVGDALVSLPSGPGAHAYRLSVADNFSATLKALDNPIDLAACLSWRSLHADGYGRAHDDASPPRDAYEQLRYERGYVPDEISIVARPERGAIDIVIAAPGSTKKRPAARRRA